MADEWLKERLVTERKNLSILEKYWKLEKPPQDLNGVYMRLLESAKNRNMMPTVIDSVIGDIKKLEEVLKNFAPKKVIEKYASRFNWASVSDDMINACKPKKKPRITNRSLWPKFCQAVISGARFLAPFNDDSQFYEWMSPFNKDEITRASLAMLLSYEVDGLAFALGCDFIIRLGYKGLSENFGKPDVHLRTIFSELGLCERNRDYDVFKAILRVARNVGKKPYKVDRLFWLIGSGNFYLDSDIHKIGTNRGKFIQYAKMKRPDLFGKLDESK